MTTYGQNVSRPLEGVVVVECGGVGPAPFAGMLLAELGADVVRVERPGFEPPFGLSEHNDPLARGKRLVRLDLRATQDAIEFAAMLDACDVLLEGFRPGVMERLGFGPQDCHQINPRLVYGRMTGWGQSGPRADQAGHDINYLAVTGALNAMGTPESPTVPLNVVGDFGGGSMYLVAGVLGALFARQTSGVGCTIDAAIVDGSCHLLGLVHGLDALGQWTHQREANLFDGGAPFYGVYETADGQHVAVGAVEPKFYAAFLAVIGLEEIATDQYERASWEVSRKAIAAVVRSRTRHDWEFAFEGVDACFTPVLSFDEAADDPHLQARGSLLHDERGVRPGPAPRFSISHSYENNFD